MEKQGLKEQWTEETIREYVKQAAESEPIPDKLQPKQMEAWLKQTLKERGEAPFRPSQQEEPELKQTLKEQGEAPDFSLGDTQNGQKQPMEEKGGASMNKKRDKKRSYRRWWLQTAAVAACLAVVLFAAGRSVDWERGVQKNMEELELAVEQPQEKASQGDTEKGASYQELYDAFSDIWKEQEKMTAYIEERATDSAGMDTGGESSAEMPAEGAAVATETVEDSADLENSGSEAYGKTNQQEAEVEEADIIKNDGRYLYQVVYENKSGKHTVQIVDTRDGLKEVSRIGEFDNEIQQIYVWKDSLAVIESGWVSDPMEEEDTDSGNLLDGVKGFVEEIFSSKTGDYYRETSYSRIHIYDIKDRQNPELYHTFTLKGSYRDSRISDGYLYFFTTCNAYRPRLEKDYQAYVPEVDGEPLAPEKIYLPEDTKTAAYLVMASVHMEQPDQFTDTTAIVTAADRFYVSKNNIYVTDSMYVDYGTEGKQSDSTRIFRFSYQDGKMKKEAEGSVKGILRDDMAMNE